MDSEIRQAIAIIQQGDEKTRDDFIRKYIPFIMRVTSQACKRFVRMGEDDEVSIALLAFNEALDKYDSMQATSFLSFAQTVIKRRIIDYFRKNAINKDIPWSSLASGNEETGEIINIIERLTWESSQSLYIEKDLSELRREEILEYQKRLQAFGISIAELVKISPKHQDARISAYKVARIVASNVNFHQHLTKTGNLPLKELEKVAEVSRKTMERQRKYIIALTVILTGEFYFLDEYIAGLKGGAK